MQNKTFQMTGEDIRLLGEALTLLLVVKRAARATQDAKQLEALTDKLLGGMDDDESQIAISV